MTNVENILNELNRHIDISCVKSNHTKEDIDRMLSYAKQYQFIGVFSMPCYTPYVIQQLKEEPFVKPCGVVGFPSGCDTTTSKVSQAKELIHMGCLELDMVMAHGLFKSGNSKYVYEDMKQVIEVSENIPVKVIIEASYLSDYEIATACELAVKAGATFVKSATGWTQNPTTPHMIKVMKDAVGDMAFIKAAGGIRSLDTILEMADLGCERFGLGIDSALSIMKKLDSRK